MPDGTIAFSLVSVMSFIALTVSIWLLKEISIGWSIGIPGLGPFRLRVLFPIFTEASWMVPDGFVVSLSQEADKARRIARDSKIERVDGFKVWDC